MQRYNVSLSEAAEVAEIPPATVRSWRHRGHDIADPPLDMGDVASLKLMGRLASFGLPLHLAAAVARAMRDQWPTVICDEATCPTMLVRVVDEAADFVVCDRAKVPAELLPLTLVVDLASILRHVMTAMASRGSAT